MTYREEILSAIHDLVRTRAEPSFTVSEVIQAVQARGSGCKEQTIKTYVAGILCADAPTKFRKCHPALRRLGTGRYCLL